MADFIQLLPDSIANQIAAGEVIQRPASVVKELMENAIDAGATSVKLIVKEAGRTLVQVIDNGCGMSETDARMSFERHATSKIKEATDLFAIRTMGFRGEALASIAAVAQVELRSRLHEEELGTRIAIEGSEVKAQEACQCMAGTSISVKNLFYNIPARRNFLKSNAVEMRHIMDEFQRVALANPEIFFSLHHNNSELFHLPPGNLRQRIVGVMGSHTNKKLVPIHQETEVTNIYGFVGKPKFAKKTRGEQYFFVNRRFIKSGYLHHAVMTAFEKDLAEDTNPLYAIFLEVDPSRIDINVHPTKQEIKFEDERIIYNYLRVAVRHALGQVTNTLDFEQETSFNAYPTLRTMPSQGESIPPLQAEGGRIRPSGPTERPSPERHRSGAQDWQLFFEGLEETTEPPEPGQEGLSVTLESQVSGSLELDDTSGSFSKHQKDPYQIHASYIISHIKSGYLLIDQQAAHERILYEKYRAVLSERRGVTQKELFPRTIELSPADAESLREILPQINQLGFDLKEFGQNAFVMHGIPAEINAAQDEQRIVETLLEQFKINTELHLDLQENLARAMAKSAAIRRGQSLSVPEMQELIDKLFACEVPFKSPGGRQCFLTFELTELDRKFGG
ncbi:MAG: DNA mismatch repair endonuclease MutL [Saprospiraceae bacterium]|nr:DNA mismatch repair endonuclease MutL [Saprospiraceae bacterium]MCB0677844.1 DNA mismatch repair endonuclease MutL [Saprospiraceae bacterium]MCB0682554.1 DNA mismatch repair endonuclease MutL [Saprospiraceae bacterium]